MVPRIARHVVRAAGQAMSPDRAFGGRGRRQTRRAQMMQDCITGHEIHNVPIRAQRIPKAIVTAGFVIPWARRTPMPIVSFFIGR
jgi:hypothetical protein